MAEILLTLRVTIPDIGPSQVELWRGVTRMSQMYQHGNEAKELKSTNSLDRFKKAVKALYQLPYIN